MGGGPHLPIDVKLIGRDHFSAFGKFALLATLHMVRHRREPDVDVETVLMAAVVGKHGPAGGWRVLAVKRPFQAVFLAVFAGPPAKLTAFRLPPVRFAGRPLDLPAGAVLA